MVTRKIKHYNIFTAFLQMFYFTRNYGLSNDDDDDDDDLCRG